MTHYPLYADTVRATGIVPDHYEGEPEKAAGVAVVEFPSIGPGVVYYGSLIPAPSRGAPLPVLTELPDLLPQRRLPERYPSRRL